MIVKRYSEVYNNNIYIPGYAFDKLELLSTIRVVFTVFYSVQLCIILRVQVYNNYRIIIIITIHE